jgi:predicted O-methyltransferase YrrM
VAVKLLLPVERLDLPDLAGLRNGYMPSCDTAAIVVLLTQVDARRVVEIGVNEGKTARELLRLAPAIADYLGIEVAADHRPPLDYQREEIPAEPGRVVLADPRFHLMVRPRGSHDIDPDEIGPCDAMLIDGDHSRRGVLNDTALALACVRPGGIVIWHDYKDGDDRIGVPAALHDLAKRGSNIRHADGTWIAFMRI